MAQLPDVSTIAAATHGGQGGIDEGCLWYGPQIDNHCLSVAIRGYCGYGGCMNMSLPRNDRGQFAPSSNLGKQYGVRVPRDLEPELERRAAAAGQTPTEYIRALVVMHLKGGDVPPPAQ